ncbi:Terminase small subunit [compost metagenome]
MNLSAKQKLFIQEYLIDLNASAAYIRAGYKSKNPDVDGHKLLVKPSIQEAVKEAMDKRSKRTEITADRVLEEYAKIAFSNITDFLKINTAERVVDRKKVTDAEGNESIVPIYDMVQGVELFDSDEVGREKMSIVSSVKQGEFGIELKLHDKKGALDMLSKHLGIAKEGLGINVNIGVQIVDDIGSDDDDSG